MAETIFGYQIWKPVDDEARKAIIKQMEINKIHENQPYAENYKLVLEEVLDITEHSELGDYPSGFCLSIWNMAENYRKYKKDFNFEIGDAIVIYHTYKEGVKLAPCVLIVGNYFYRWNFKENKLLRDYEPVQKSWKNAIRNT